MRRICIDNKEERKKERKKASKGGRMKVGRHLLSSTNYVQEGQQETQNYTEPLHSVLVLLLPGVLEE